MRKDSLRWFQNNEINSSIVEQVEATLKVRFPPLYIEIVKKNNGAQPEVINENGEWKSGLVRVNNFGEITFCFLRYVENENVILSKIMKTYKAFKDTLPESEKIIPFADDGGGNHLYFDYRNSESNPSIVFQHHEKAISKDDLSEWDLKKRPLEELLNDSLIHVADSFEKLLEMLYPAEW